MQFYIDCLQLVTSPSFSVQVSGNVSVIPRNTKPEQLSFTYIMASSASILLLISQLGSAVRGIT